jgi:Circadian oscillating protein COP23
MTNLSMMKLNFSSLITRIAIGMGILVLNGVNPPIAKAEGVTYFCGKNGRLPAVFAKNTGGNVFVLVEFSSDYFNERGWPPKVQCNIAVKRLTEFNEQGILQKSRLVIQHQREYHIICISEENKKSCAKNGGIFIIDPRRDPYKVLNRILQISEDAGGLFDP